MSGHRIGLKNNATTSKSRVTVCSAEAGVVSAWKCFFLKLFLKRMLLTPCNVSTDNSTGILTQESRVVKERSVSVVLLAGGKGKRMGVSFLCCINHLFHR